MAEPVDEYAVPFEENLRKKGLEEHHVTDPMEEYAVYQFKESDAAKPNPTTKKGLNLGDVDEKKTLEEELKAELKPPTKLMKHIPADKIEAVTASDKIVDSSCVLTTSEYGWSAEMERIVEAQGLRDNSMTSHMVSKKIIEVKPTHSIMTELMMKAAAWRQQHTSNQHQPTKQPAQQEREEEKKGQSEKVEREEWETVVVKGRKGQRGRGQERRKEEEEKEAEEGRGEQVEEDVTGWTEVTRKKRKKMVQIFVKVDGSRVIPMEVSPADDKVEDVMKRIQKDEDVYVTMHGKVLRRSEKLNSCGVTDGCTVQVTSRLRGGGKHKDKKGQKERKRAVKPKGPEQKSEEEPKSDEGPALIQMDEVLRRMEGNEEFQKIIDWVSEGSEGEVQQKVQSYLATIRMSWMSKEQFEYLESGVWRAIEARRKERREEHKQRRQEEQELGEEEKPLEETRAESTDEPEVAGRLVEVRTGRGSAGLVRGGDERNWADESNRKGKGKGNGGKGEHGSKGGAGSKGTQQVENLTMDGDQEDKRGRVAPNMGAGGSHPQATSDPGKKEEEKREARVLSWADCKDEEVQNEEEVEEEKETRQEEELTGEKPPGLEANEESEHEAKEEEERRRAQEAEEKRLAQEAREEQRRAEEAREDEERKAQEARKEEEKRAQEAREDEERQAQEAREEERRAQEARERRRAQEAREDEERKAQEVREEERRAQEAREQKKVQEAQEKEAKAQEEREEHARRAKVQEERTEHESNVKAQDGHEVEVKAQEGQGEDANSMHEESHVSNRHMTWWHNAWWVRVKNGPHLQTARDRRRVWRAATRAAQEVRETGKVAGKERREWEKGETERKESNTLHLVIHIPTASTSTAAAAAAAATVRLQ